MRRNKAELAFALGDVNAEAVPKLFHAEAVRTQANVRHVWIWAG